VAADTILYVNCSVAASVNTHVKGFANACYKDKEDVTKDIIYYKDKEDKQRCKEVITSLIKIKLRWFKNIL
jgi:hypothetical protein